MAMTDNVLGLILAIFGSFNTALGLMMFKIGNIKVEQNSNKSVLSTKEFWLGMICLTLS
jgi:hypothetical protein